MRHTALKTLATATQTPAPTGYTYYLPDCSFEALERCYYNGQVNGVFVKAVEPGDTIQLPAGSATWGYNVYPAGHPNAGQTHPNLGTIFIILPITIRGQGDNTVITVADNSSRRYNSGIFAAWTSCTVADIKFIGPSSQPTTLFWVQPYNNTAPGGVNFTGNLRLTNLTYQGGTGSSYFMYGGKVTSTLIDNCRISGATGNSELIFARGPDNAWQNNNTLGTASNIFIEDCTFSSSGYVNDANSNARMVVRFCTITGPIKVDGHGLASNGSPSRGYRNMETYHNTWTYSSPAWAAIELRGGTNMVFNNRSNVQNGWFFLTDYGYLSAWPNFGSVFQTPTNYPITDQIGVSKDPKTAAGEPNYVWGNRVGTAVWQRQTKAVNSGAITLYQTQTGNPSATFTERDMIQANRDFYAEAGFENANNGAPAEQQIAGVSIGTKAEMLAFTPPFVKYGWWVTDEGTWNRTPGGPQGRLYTWNGSSWNVYYEPYTYPHPLRP